jgi:hypothetical protein
MDAGIQTVVNQFFQQEQKVRDEHVGIKGDKWHPAVVQVALRGTGYTLLEYRDPATWYTALTTADKTDIFVVEGYLNRSFLRAKYPTSGNAKKGARYYHEGHDDAKYHDEECWRHTIAIRSQRIYCSGLPDRGVPIDNLWLVEGSDRSRDGYLSMIRTVFKFNSSSTVH